MRPSLLQNTILKQYRAPLAMLHQAIEICPETLWLSTEYHNRFWHIAYHSLFYTHLYLQPAESDFQPWPKHRPEVNFLATPNPQPPYSQRELLEYHALCSEQVEQRVPELHLEAESGFHWLTFSKLELQFYNIRHLQHHTGQLADRLRNAAGLGLAWRR